MSNDIKLSTGRVICGAYGFFSVSSDLRRIGSGYDSTLYCEDWEPGEDLLTAAEAVEVADIMIDRWRAMREKVIARVSAAVIPPEWELLSNSGRPDRVELRRTVFELRMTEASRPAFDLMAKCAGSNCAVRREASFYKIVDLRGYDRAGGAVAVLTVEPFEGEA